MKSKALHVTISRVNKKHRTNVTFVTSIGDMSKSLKDGYYSREQLLDTLLTKNWNASDFRSKTEIVWLATAYLHNIPELYNELYKNDDDMYVFGELVQLSKNKYDWTFSLPNKQTFDKITMEIHK